jgi:NADH dehydrogenase (ubiquinone) Fe-S protein 8
MLASSAASVAARQLQLPLMRTTSSTLVRTNPAQALLVASARRGYATPAGPPPKRFRLKPPVEWDQEKESTLDKAGKYFLMTEMLRGMYVLLEQFFRPP